ncbi:hypothetical protein CQ393_07405 [Stenotrophomonas sp. MYb238]|nr:hypothetical protein [Stenotrophomonas sp. MYb238]
MSVNTGLPADCLAPTGIRVRHLLQPCRLPAIAHLRAGLRAPLLALLAMFAMLAPAWQSAALSTTVAGLAAHAPASGEESPAGESAERENPAKLRRAAPLQAPRAAWNRPAPPRSAACAGDETAVAVRSTVPAVAPAPPAATPVRWRLQRSQAPPLA